VFLLLCLCVVLLVDAVPAGSVLEDKTPQQGSGGAPGTLNACGYTTKPCCWLFKRKAVHRWQVHFKVRLLQQLCLLLFGALC
jgi:hypothetical protein